LYVFPYLLIAALVATCSVFILLGVIKYLIFFCASLCLLLILFICKRHRDVFLAIIGLLPSVNFAKYLSEVTIGKDNFDVFAFYAIDAPVMLLLLSIILFKNNSNYNIDKYSKLAGIAGTMFCLWSMVSASIAIRSDIALLESLRYCRLFILWQVIVLAIDDKQSLYACISGLLLGLFVQSSLAITQAIFHNSFGLYYNDSVRLIGTKISRSGGSLNPTVLAQFIGVIAPICLALALETNHAMKRRLYLFVYLLALIASFLTLSRGGWLNLIVSTVVVIAYFVKNPDWLMKQKGNLLSLGIMAAGLTCAGAGLVIKRVLSSSTDTSVTGRFVQYNLSFKLISDHLVFGVGLGNFLNAVSAYMYLFPFPVHNKFLLITSETGLIGLALFVSYWCCISMGAIRACSKANFSMRPVAIGVLGGLLGSFVNMQSDIYALAGAPELSMFILAGLVSAANKQGFYQGIKI
jgi:O-antigen ligase